MILMIDTFIGFLAIMLFLSYLIKGLTSLVKDHVDYYTDNLRGEVDSFLNGCVKKTLKTLSTEHTWLKQIQWNRLDEKFLTEQNMEWLLTELGTKGDDLKQMSSYFKARLEVHKANIRFAFEKRTKKIALAMGLTVALALNINAFSILDTLYRDEDVRAKFSSAETVQMSLDLDDKYRTEIADPQTSEERRSWKNSGKLYSNKSTTFAVRYHLARRLFGRNR